MCIRDRSCPSSPLMTTVLFLCQFLYKGFHSSFFLPDRLIQKQHTVWTLSRYLTGIGKADDRNRGYGNFQEKQPAHCWTANNLPQGFCYQTKQCCKGLV